MTRRLTGISVAQMREVDRLMIEDYDVALLQMMENAGRSLAELARLHLASSVAGRRIVALIGPGNNGGGGLVAARHLANAGASVVVALARAAPLPNEAPERQRRFLERMGLPGSELATAVDDLPDLLDAADLILDALLGYSGRGAPREPIADVIHAANSARAPRLALDLPSGLDSDSGLPATPTLQAVATLTLAWPKRGLLAPTAQPFVGALFLADISIPAAVYQAPGVESGTLFASGPIVRLRPADDGWEPETRLSSGAW
ncbi:MAG TPA: NAD(P)H-hydrate epimerase [Ktedonobacterales bacterium]|nr:NAD(P)H-hydrate epimerase [Ktedonobacterales bacterium]